MLAPDHRIVLYGIVVTRHLARASQCDLPAGGANCVPMAIWRFVIRVLHRHPVMRARLPMTAIPDGSAFGHLSCRFARVLPANSAQWAVFAGYAGR